MFFQCHKLPNQRKYKCCTHLLMNSKNNNNNSILCQLCKVVFTRPNVPTCNYVIQFSVLFSFSLKHLQKQHLGNFIADEILALRQQITELPLISAGPRISLTPFKNYYPIKLNIKRYI